MGVLWKQYMGGLQVQYLLCSYKDGVKTSFINKRYDGNCELMSSSELDSNYPNKIIVYPNPTKDYITMESNQPMVFDKIQIVNSLGEIKFLPTESHTIYLTEYPSGMYTLLFISISGAFYSYSIIKL